MKDVTGWIEGGLGNVVLMRFNLFSAAAVLAGQQAAVAVVNPYPPSGPAK